MQTNSAFGKIPAVLTFPFRGEGWFGKLAIAALIMLAGMFIPIIPTIFLLGYLAEIIRRITVENQDASMPEWNDWGKFFNDGLKILGASLIVIIPIVIIFMILGTLYFIPLLTIGIDDSGTLAASIYIVIFFIQMIMMFIGVLVSVLAGLFQPIYMTHMVTQDQFGAIFKVKAWWQIFKNSFWEFMISFLLLASLYTFVTYVTVLLVYSVICCCLTPFVSAVLMAYMLLVYVALMAYAYRNGMEKLGELVKKPAPQPVTPKADFDLPEAIETIEPVPAADPIEVVEDAEPVFETPAETIAEATIVSTVVVETAELVETPNLPEAPALEATLVGEPVVVDEVEIVEDLFVEQSTIKIDDLKKINGIGPKTAAALSRAGILTYRQLAELPLENLKQMLTEADLEILVPQCHTWTAQAKEMIQ